MKIRTRFRIANASPLERALNSRVKAYLTRHGRTANAEMWLRVLFCFALYFGCWSALVFVAHSLSVTLLLGMGLILAYKCMAYNVVHDGVHCALSGRPALDRAIYSVALSLLGPDPYLWRTRHTVDHHHYVNIPGLDSQLESAKFLRISPHQEWRPFHRFQHLYAPFLYGLVTLHWIFVRDFADLYRENSSPVRWALTLSRKSLYVGGMIVLPALMLPYAWPTVLLGFLGFHFVLSVLVTLTFAVSHVNSDLQYVEPGRDAEIGHSLVEHQLITSMDYHPTHPVSNWIFGGMSAHVAHHLFPTVSSAKLPELTRIVEKAVAEHGGIYHVDTLGGVLSKHFRLLRELGRSSRVARGRVLRAKSHRHAG